MDAVIWIYAYFLIVSFVLTWLTMPAAHPLARRLGLVDDPGGWKLHDRPMPLAGGLILFGIFAIVLLVHGLVLSGNPSLAPEKLRTFTQNLPESTWRIASLVASAVLIYFLGGVDDSKRLGVRSRLAAQFGAAALAIIGGIQPTFEGIPYWVGVSGSIVWVVIVTNAYNMVDGLDGLAAGLGMIAAVLLGISLHMAGQPQGVVVMAALAGCLGGFLRHNFHPARVFMGSAGAMTVGHILGCMALYLGVLKGANIDVHAYCIPLLIMAIPLYDISSVIVLRILGHQPITQGDNRHFHYRLLRMGFSHKQAVWFMWLLAIIAGLPVIPLASLDRGMSLAMLTQVFAMCLALIVIERAYNRLGPESKGKDTERVSKPKEKIES